MQDDNFSYKNCYKHGSCVKKKKTNKQKNPDLKKILRRYSPRGPHDRTPDRFY